LEIIVNKPYSVGMRLPLRSAALSAAAAVALSGCGGADGTAGAAEDDRPQVLVGLYPYEFVAFRVGGDAVDVVNLTPPGVEPHDLELSPRQVAQLAEADLVLYSPGFSPALDAAVDDQAADRAVDVLQLVDVRAYTEEHAGEAEHAEEEGHAEEGDEHEGDEHEGEDPHVWLDPSRLATIATAVAGELAEAAPEQADAFAARAEQLTAELEALDGELRQGLSSCERTDVVVSHDAFGYLTERYGLEQVAVSLSPDEDPSPRRLAEVAATAREQGVTTIFFEELVSPRVAEQLAREAGAQARVLSPLEGAPEDGDYLTAMRANLEALRAALGCA
jgi:zinc transport system substrate-binding protein